jgi:hypothetical protein
MFQNLRNLRVFAVLILGGTLVACSKPAAEENFDGWVVCEPSENIAVCYFRGCMIQGDASRRPVVDALKDALTLPLEELRTRRYANYQMEPEQWSFTELFGKHYTCISRMPDSRYVRADMEGFMEAFKQPEALPTLEKEIAELEESVRYMESGD